MAVSVPPIVAIAPALPTGFGGNAAQADLPVGHSLLLRPPRHRVGPDGHRHPGQPGAAACLTGVTVGTWHPAPSGRPIPAVPVAG